MELDLCEVKSADALQPENMARHLENSRYSPRLMLALDLIPTSVHVTK